MRFTPREIEGNVNVSPTRPLSEFAWLVGELVLVVLAIYLLLGLASDLVAARIPIEAEGWLGRRALAAYHEDASPAMNRRLQELIRTLPADSPLRRYRFSVHLVESGTVNAVALPGGSIVVYSGLLRRVRSENELAMVIAHELGHYAHRDHLRGLGRGLGIAVATQILLGADNSVTELVSKLTLPLFARYSQTQEQAADAFAVDLVQNRFGHAGGAGDFFRRLAGEPGGDLSYILASHPSPQARVQHIREQIARKGYPVRPTLQLAADLSPKGSRSEAGPRGALKRVIH
jgi:predicted Zn-dependent protease